MTSVVVPLRRDRHDRSNRRPAGISEAGERIGLAVAGGLPEGREGLGR